jgi:hypothetical protein
MINAAKEQVVAILRAHSSGLRSEHARSRPAEAGMPLDPVEPTARYEANPAATPDIFPATHHA